MSALGALALFGVFAACVLAVLLTGAGAYRRLTERDSAAGDRRTRVQYIAARVRQADRPEGVTAGQLGDTPALRVAEPGGYVTWVYCWDGWLMELYTSEEAGLGPEDGTPLTQASGLSLTESEGLLEVAVTGPDGTEDRLYLALESGEGAQYEE